MEWQLSRFDELGAARLYRMLTLRSAVFVVEQDCAYQDLDGLDLHPQVRHLNLWQGEQLLAGARLLGPGVLAPDQVWIGRVMVAPAQRGRGLARSLMRRAMAEAGRLWPGQPLWLGAQVYVLDFYASLGFVPVGEEYLEDGIPHRRMMFACSA